MSTVARLTQLIDAYEAVAERMGDVPMGIFATQAAWDRLKINATNIEESVAFNSIDGMPVWISQFPEIDGPREAINRQHDVLVATIEDDELVVRQFYHKQLLKLSYMDPRLY